MANIIGLIGRRSSGKTTVAKLYNEKFGDRRMAFADALKDVVAFVYDLRRELLEGETEESRVWRKQPHPHLGGKTPEQALQFLGTEGFRQFYSETWVQKLIRDICKLEAGTRVVIADVRFPNEVEAIKQLGGNLVYLKRPNSEIQAHASEQVEALEKECYCTIHNDQTRQDLLIRAETTRNELVRLGRY